MTNFDEKFKSLFDFENDMSYYYHVTGHGIGDKICEEGLMMTDRNLNSTTIKITPQMINDSETFIADEHGNNIRETDEMVLLGCPTEEVPDIVISNTEGANTWTSDEEASYIIPNRYVMGYVDMATYNIILNDNYEYGDDIDLGMHR